MRPDPLSVWLIGFGLIALLWLFTSRPSTDDNLIGGSLEPPPRWRRWLGDIWYDLWHHRSAGP